MISNSVKTFILPHEFFMPFEGTLNPENRWCKLAAMIKWWLYEDEYNKAFKNKIAGQKAKNVRIALGALIIQAKLNLTDVEVVETIMENVYLQYFIGLTGFTLVKPFDASLMVHFRKRLKPELIAKILEDVAFEGLKVTERNDQSNDDDDTTPPAVKKTEQSPDQLNLDLNQGNLILDATCVPADVHYPTDLWLLNDAVERLYTMLTKLTDAKKPMKTAGKKHKCARNAYLSIVRQKQPRKKAIREAIKVQLNSSKYLLEQVLRHDTDHLSKHLKKSNLKALETIQTVMQQQLTMFKNKSHSVANRIISISQPHVRPIIRGKAKARVEFGAKLSISVVDGYCLLERLDFDSFNEGITLIESVEQYYERFGNYPEAVMADQIYRNRANRAYCKSKDIRLSGPKLGRPKKDNSEDKRQEYVDSGIRNAVEGKFGEAKRAYGLDLMQVRLEESSKTMILVNLLVLNLEKRLRTLFVQIFRLLLMYKNNMERAEISVC